MNSKDNKKNEVKNDIGKVLYWLAEEVLNAFFPLYVRQSADLRGGLLQEMVLEGWEYIRNTPDGDLHGLRNALTTGGTRQLRFQTKEIPRADIDGEAVEARSEALELLTNKEAFSDLEWRVLNALYMSGGNRKQAAAFLDVSPKVVYNCVQRLKKRA